MADLTPSITQLTTALHHNAQIIEKYLTTNFLPPLSLSESALPFFPGTGPTDLDPFPPLPSEVVEARRSLRDTAELLLQLVSTPAETLMWGITTAHHHSSACLQYVHHFGAADVVPIGGSISFADLAAKIGVDERQCTRILRTLMTQYMFCESTSGMVSHTAMSKLLTVPGVRDSVGYLIEESFPGAPHISETAERHKGSGERNHAPWNVGHNIDLPIFEFFEQSPRRMQRFLGNMQNFGSQSAYDIRHLVTGYDWAAVEPGVLVDVGGSLGHVSIALSKVAPQLEFVVQDLENVVEDMNQRAASTLEGSYERVRWEAHDFFEEQPIEDAAVYLLRFILHDYSDEYAIKILRALVPAMGRQSRILVFDGVMPEPNTLMKFEERMARCMDMEMMLTYNAIERDLEGWKALFMKADEKLRLRTIVSPVGSAHSIMELTLQ